MKAATGWAGFPRCLGQLGPPVAPHGTKNNKKPETAEMTEIVVWGMAGGFAAEFLRWYKLRTSTELPNTYAAPSTGC